LISTTNKKCKTLFNYNSPSSYKKKNTPPPTSQFLKKTKQIKKKNLNELKKGQKLKKNMAGFGGDAKKKKKTTK
ncbi:hypothetical protein, partial [Escherichia coli]|uniref:hypothetical protein n=1 Tax=Escherichia coli TaxID=562 RepID=UPI002FBE8B20